MPKEHDALRAFVREMLKELDETLKPGDVALSRQEKRSDVASHGMGQEVRVHLDGKTWLTRSQAEVDRVLRLGGKIVDQGAR